MKANTVRMGVVLATGLILLSSCSLGRRGSAVSPREQARGAGLSADLQAIKMENEALKRQQQESDARIQELRRLLTEDQEKQKQFRDTMTTNFDLLEQSVALTLSKGIGSVDLVAEDKSSSRHVARVASKKPAPKAVARSAPAPLTAPRNAARKNTTAAANGVKAGGPAMAKPGAAGVAVSRPPLDAPPMENVHKGLGAKRSGSTSLPGVGNTVPPAAMPADDPDLRLPAQPRHLTPHRESKPLYEKGFALFANKEYDQAVIVFENFLNRFPDDIYSDNAQFWIGESYLRMNRPVEAEAAYRKVLRNYEHRSTLEGYKTPDAIYRIGQTYQQRSDNRKARYYYAAVAQRFPGSSAGRRAQRELESAVASTAAN